MIASTSQTCLHMTLDSSIVRQQEPPHGPPATHGLLCMNKMLLTKTQRKYSKHLDEPYISLLPSKASTKRDLNVGILQQTSYK